ncbi:bL21 family ribosomal protein [Candidatus Amesbacteria bacterium]|nr:bL21 family ribosomal protein [Candidatus Amesbacteria bacterium]
MSPAVVKIGASQFSVEPGQIILASKPQIDSVVYPPDSQVLAENLGPVKGPKVQTLKYKAKSRYHKTHGHRAVLYRLQITGITSVK